MDETTSEPKTNGRAARRPNKLVIDGVEIKRPPFPPTTPLWRIRRGARIAVKQYVRDLAARK
jgi:hypothetical protein